jgi:hypothetical protein
MIRSEFSAKPAGVNLQNCSTGHECATLAMVYRK